MTDEPEAGAAGPESVRGIPRAAVASALALALLALAGGATGVAALARGGGGPGIGLELEAAPRPAARTFGALAPSLAATSAPESVTALAGRLATARPAGERFDADNAVRHAREIARTGVRPGGGDNERAAAAYIRDELIRLGYEPVVDTFRLPNGRSSRNVIARLPGYASGRTVVIGAHFDTKPPSPGGNDNASGCGVVLELARLLKQSPAAGETMFAFYGTEEFLLDAPGDNHHLGSRRHAASFDASETANIAAMVSADMVGWGPRFTVRTMLRGPQTVQMRLRDVAGDLGIALEFDKDRGRTGWSDHEPFELRGVPAAWLQWQSDPAYHTAADDADHIALRPMKTTGRLLLEFVRGLDPDALEELCDR